MTDTNTNTTTPASEAGFDADARAHAREAADIKIGGRVFHRRRRTNRVASETRRLQRVHNRAAAEMVRAIDARDKLDDDFDVEMPDDADDQLNRADETAEAAIGRSEQAAFELLSHSIQDGDGNRPDVEFLKESLDSEDAIALSRLLILGETGEPDPTKGSPGSSD